MNLLNLHLHERCGQDFPIVQYVDDTLLIMEACPRQLFFLKEIVHTFVESTGLRVNYNKSSIYPINVSDKKWRFYQELSTIKLVQCPSHTLVCLKEFQSPEYKTLCH
jgi:hypothetical protein